MLRKILLSPNHNFITPIGRNLCNTTPLSGRGCRNTAEDDPWPNILQLHTEGLKDNKISVTEHLASKNKAFIIVPQEAHCITADKLVIHNFSLPGSILSRNHGLATFVHERLEWSLVDPSPDQSETEWLCQWHTQKIFMGGFQSAKSFLCIKIESMIRKNIKQAAIQYVNVVKQL